MIRARWVVVLILGAVLATVAREAYELAVPPSHRTPAPNSFSGRINGHRGLVEVLDSLGLEVSRGFDFFARPGAAWEATGSRVLIIEPSLMLMDREQALVDAGVPWVESGGELLIVSEALDLLDTMRARRDGARGPAERDWRQTEALLGERGLVKSLGFEDLRVAARPRRSRDRAWHEYDVVRLDRLAFARPEVPHALEASGTLSGIVADVETVYLPDGRPRGFTGGDIERADGVIYALHEGGARYPVALSFAVGDGRVTLASEPALFHNLGLKSGDNAVVAARLAAGDGNRGIVYDEYFHGAMPVGRPLVLFGIFPYGVIAGSILLAAAIAAWASGVRFGPPLADPPPSRRSILEYVDAMARLFMRSGRHRFVLHACMTGVLDDIREEFFLPHGTPPERILHALERRDAERAARLRTALDDAKKTLRESGRLSRARLAKLQGTLEACRTPKALQHRARTPSVRFSNAR